MLTEYARDATFSVAWFGLMTFVWLGWSQEDPPRRLRAYLGIGSVIGLLLAIGFGIATAVTWHSPSSLDGNYSRFGVLVGAEVLLAGAGCAILAVRGRHRWMAWWTALIVAAHFLPLAWLLYDPSIAVLGGGQLAALAALTSRLRRSNRTTSRAVGPLMGATLLCYAGAAGTLLAAGTIG